MQKIGQKKCKLFTQLQEALKFTRTLSDSISSFCDYKLALTRLGHD